MLSSCKGETVKLTGGDVEGDEMRGDDSENEIGSPYSIELEGITLPKRVITATKCTVFWRDFMGHRKDIML